jgi:nitrous oxide reductase accessory protein NosL
VKVLVLLALLAACSKKAEDAPPAEPPPAISQDEIKRGVDACADYTKRVCECGPKAPVHAEACKLAPAYSDAIDMARAVALNPETKRKDAVQAAASIRNTVKTCVEEAAKLAASGCP